MATHVLKEAAPGRVEFKARGMALLFPVFFIAVGIGVIITAGLFWFKQGDKEIVFLGLFGFVFFLAGLFILRAWMTPRVFDRSTGFYWRGRKIPDNSNVQSIKECCRLIDIHAIQLLDEYIRSSSDNGRNTSFYSYELNLVLKDGKRLNVVDHGKLSLIRDDAAKLAGFLNVPVWDVIRR